MKDITRKKIGSAESNTAPIGYYVVGEPQFRMMYELLEGKFYEGVALHYLNVFPASDYVGKDIPMNAELREDGCVVVRGWCLETPVLCDPQPVSFSHMDRINAQSEIEYSK